VREREPFTYQDEAGDHEAFGLDIVTGQRMAKTFNFKKPAYGQEMSAVTLGTSFFMEQLGLKLAASAVKQLRGEVTEYRGLTLTSSTMIQYDGEAKPLVEGTFVSFLHEPSMLNLVLPPDVAA
jgi:hypothetical protein